MNRTCEKCIHYGVCIIHEPCGYYEEERPHGEWIVDKKIYCSECGESICDFIPNPTDAVGLILSNNFCFNCGSDNRPRKHGCPFADEECKNNPCADCGLKEGETNE